MRSTKKVQATIPRELYQRLSLYCRVEEPQSMSNAIGNILDLFFEVNPPELMPRSEPKLSITIEPLQVDEIRQVNPYDLLYSDS